MRFPPGPTSRSILATLDDASLLAYARAALKPLRRELILFWTEVRPVAEALLVSTVALLVAIWCMRIFWLGWD